jgi:hypothetical protein
MDGWNGAQHHRRAGEKSAPPKEVTVKKKVVLMAAMAAFLVPAAFSAQKPAPKQIPSPSAQQTRSAMPALSPMPAKSAMGSPQELTGRIVSISETKLVVSHGKQKSTFALTPDTQREGKLTRGKNVKVDYMTQGTESIATLVQAEGAKASPHSKTSRSKY